MMLYALEGTLVHKESTLVVLDVGGLFFELAIPLSVCSRLPEEGKRCRLFTELVIGEKGVKLYGFAAREEKLLFNELRKVSKIGPQTALSVLSCLSVDQFYRAVRDKDEATIRSVPGIGKKTALSIILEFSSKLPEEDSQPSLVKDAEDALVNMGFSPQNVRQLVRGIYEKNPGISLEELLKESLKKIKDAR